jgi:hypothetical protein
MRCVQLVKPVAFVFQIYMGPCLFKTYRRETAAPELDLLPPTPSAFRQSEYDVEGYTMHLGTIPHHSHSADALDSPIIGRHF